MIIKTQGLKKIYQMGGEQVKALDGVDIELERGEYVAIMGPSGSGKSTLMNLLGCLDTPSEGEYWLNGHDFVFVDQRGTGKSNPLQCDFFGDDPQSYLGSLFPIEKVRKCREKLKDKADLTKYTTMDFIQDLEDVRHVLGYDRINLIGGSYGTRAAFVYLRMYPNAIGSAVLSGVSPPTQRAPLSYPKDAQQSLDALFNQCKLDETCKNNFPDPAKDLQSILNRFDKEGKIKTSIKISENETKAVELTRSVFAERLRFMNMMEIKMLTLLIFRIASSDLASWHRHTTYHTMSCRDSHCWKTFRSIRNSFTHRHRWDGRSISSARCTAEPRSCD